MEPGPQEAGPGTGLQPAGHGPLASLSAVSVFPSSVLMTECVWNPEGDRWTHEGHLPLAAPFPRAQSRGGPQGSGGHTAYECSDSSRAHSFRTQTSRHE